MDAAKPLDVVKLMDIALSLSIADNELQLCHDELHRLADREMIPIQHHPSPGARARLARAQAIVAEALGGVKV